MIGDEVIVHGEKKGEPINLDVFYGTVTGVGLVSEVRFEYEVTDNDGRKHNLHRKDDHSGTAEYVPLLQ